MSQDPEDDDPHVVIAPSADDMDCGEIDAAAAKAVGIPAGPIRLYNGYKSKKGWGLQHVLVTPGRVQQIERCGFKPPIAFACAVGRNWVRLHEGPPPRGLDRISVVWPQDGMEYALALQWNGRAWSIVTMLPFHRMPYRLLYEKEPAA